MDDDILFEDVEVTDLLDGIALFTLLAHVESACRVNDAQAQQQMRCVRFNLKAHINCCLASAILFKVAALSKHK